MPNIEQWVPEAQAAFVARMRSAAAYPRHTVSAPIRCVETHISWVFLTGRFAYKVKKPVQLPFVDYSTAARREECCREELRLNRRYAPELYVDVVPIGGTPLHPRVGDSTTPAFEHALQMLQFDARAELSALLEHGAVEPDEVRALGSAIATLHAESAVVVDGSEFGAPERIQRVVEDNFTDLARTVTPVHGEASDALRAAMREHHGRLRVPMSTRRGAGCIRECHGDLHCGNVVRWRGRLVPFDGLEFDPALRHIDVASDIAFLSMDLAARGHAGLRREFLNSWTEASGDFAAIELLRYYECYRALVRAKVAALSFQGRGVDGNSSRIAMQRYLAWACAHAVPRRPTLVLMSGLSGSGKTWLAQRLAQRIDALHVRSDVERKRLAGLAPLASSNSPPDAGIYSLDFNRRTYARLEDCAAHCLAGGENVIVDAASLRQSERSRFATIADGAAATFRVVHCTAPLEVLKTRIAARRKTGADASEATVDLLERQPAYWEPFTADETPLVIGADTSAACTLDQVVVALQGLT